MDGNLTHYVKVRTMLLLLLLLLLPPVLTPRTIYVIGAAAVQ